MEQPADETCGISALVAKSLITIALAGTLSACISMSGMNKDAAFSADSRQGLMIIGISPEYRIGAKRGEVTPSDFINSDLSVFQFNITPEQGYIVTPASPTSGSQAYAVLQALPSGFTGPAFTACDGLNAPTFEVKAGEIVYAGDFEYQQSGSRLRVVHSHDLDKAAAHLRRNYPQVRGTPRYVEPVWRTVKRMPCSNPTTLYIPVFVPARR